MPLIFKVIFKNKNRNDILEKCNSINNIQYNNLARENMDFADRLYIYLLENCMAESQVHKRQHV